MLDNELFTLAILKKSKNKNKSKDSSFNYDEYAFKFDGTYYGRYSIWGFLTNDGECSVKIPEWWTNKEFRDIVWQIGGDYGFGHVGIGSSSILPGTNFEGVGKSFTSFSGYNPAYNPHTIIFEHGSNEPIILNRFLKIFISTKDSDITVPSGETVTIDDSNYFFIREIAEGYYNTESGYLWDFWETFRQRGSYSFSQENISITLTYEENIDGSSLSITNNSSETFTIKAKEMFPEWCSINQEANWPSISLYFESQSQEGDK